MAVSEWMSMMEPDLQHTVFLLTRAPAAFNALLRDLPQTWASRNEGENTWSAHDVVAHLVHTERTDWLPRGRGPVEQIPCGAAVRRPQLFCMNSRDKARLRQRRFIAGCPQARQVPSSAPDEPEVAAGSAAARD